MVIVTNREFPENFPKKSGFRMKNQDIEQKAYFTIVEQRKIKNFYSAVFEKIRIITFSVFFLYGGNPKKKTYSKNKTSEMLQSGMPDFYIPRTAYHPDKNKDFSVATVLCDTKVKICLLSNFIKVLTYSLIFREVLPVLQFFPIFVKF